MSKHNVIQPSFSGRTRGPLDACSNLTGSIATTALRGLYFSLRLQSNFVVQSGPISFKIEGLGQGTKMSNNNLVIFDTTMRDGEQSPAHR